MLELVERQQILAQETGILGVQFGVGFPLTKVPHARAQHLLGRDVEPLLHDFEGFAARTVAGRALVLSYLGRCAETAALIASAGDIGAAEDESWLMSLADLLEASVHCQQVDTARALVRRLAPLAGGLHGYLVSFGRLLGDAAVLIGEYDAARDFYLQAEDVCSRTRFRPELALTRLDLADLMLSHFPRERAEALRHLDFATAELSAMHLQPVIERALRLGRSVGASTFVDRARTRRRGAGHSRTEQPATSPISS